MVENQTVIFIKSFFIFFLVKALQKMNGFAILNLENGL